MKENENSDNKDAFLKNMRELEALESLYADGTITEEKYREAKLKLMYPLRKAGDDKKSANF